MGSTSIHPQDIGHSAAEFAQDMKGKAQQIASSAAEKASTAANEMASVANSAASTIGKTAERATTAMGSGMKSLAGAIHDKAPDSGMVGAASSAVAHGLEEGGQFLKDKGLKGVGSELAALVRNHPLPTLLVGISLGYLLARAHRS